MVVVEENARESRDRARYTRNYTRAADAFLVLNADESLTQSKSSTTTDSEGQRYTQSVECEPRQRGGTATCAFGAGLSLHRTQAHIGLQPQTWISISVHALRCASAIAAVLLASRNHTATTGASTRVNVNESTSDILRQAYKVCLQVLRHEQTWVVDPSRLPKQWGLSG